MPHLKKLAALVFGSDFPAALTMLPPPMPHLPKKTINLWHFWPLWMPCPEKNQPAALVVGLCATSGIGDIASSDAASP